MGFKEEIARRRTFGIVSHPDAGKTTLTEKLLLFGGAIHVAGAVKSNKIKKTATSDFMEIERQRGISVATSVMGFEYNGVKINILDTPGHQDFAEDTFRVLTACDSVIIVIDSAKGVEAQTRRLMEVCRMRRTPVIVFMNKLDRPGMDAFDLLDEVERELKIGVTPLSWPIGNGDQFKGIYNIHRENLQLYSASIQTITEGVEIGDFADYSAAYDAGMRKGDKILALNGEGFRFYDEFTDAVEANKGKRVEATVLRGTDTLTYAFTLGNDGKFGIYVSLPPMPFELVTKDYTLWEAIPAGVRLGVEQLGSYVKQLKLLFSSGDTAVKSVGGFATIANVFPGYWNWQDFWSLTALISIMLAVVNILPIPALDGGHVLFLLYEVVTRRKPSDRFMEYAQIAGMVFIFGLFILANVNDIIKIFG